MKIPRQLFYSIFATLILLAAAMGDFVIDAIKLVFRSVLQFFQVVAPLWNPKEWK